MNIYNGNVYASPSENTKVGREILSKDPDHPGSLGVAISEAMEEALENDNVKYTLGSVLNQVMLHQTVIGQELKTQLEIAEEEPDVMIACAGGGSNLAGSLFPFIKDKIDGNMMNKPIDDFNHALDALRYSLQSIDKPRQKGKILDKKHIRI